MKQLLLSSLLACAAICAAAQPAPAPPYKVIGNSTVKSAAEQWNAAADQGYRLLLEGRLAILHLDAAPPDTYRYMHTPDRNLRNTFLNALNQQGAFGYAWVKGTQMMQKLPHPHIYEYTIVEGIADRTRAASRESLLAQGFATVGRFGSVPIYMRDTTLTPPAPRLRDIRMLDRPTPGKLFHQIEKLAAQGYRYRSYELTDSGTRVVMESRDPSSGGPFEYRSFDVKNSSDLERTLNQLAHDGFRVLPDSLDWPPHIAERGPQRDAHYSYKIGEAREAAALEQFLNDADRDGFRPIGFVAHVGWTVDPYIIVEKAPAPQ